ncbi:hypothetical protein [Rhodococcus aetherivorans]|uniref:hypothetical protein n=1 Tax=Rhodococcus aetherivorans TaxID=191292 RepID=UPI002948E0E3|nr:hypothetical protein [Rhodococcus aetherivorans]MDV6291496.1 hypothetical protein [Rhodococcus aetherivorans]
MTTPIRSVGPEPTPEMLCIGSLLWAAPDDVRPVLPLMGADDLDDPHLHPILDAIRRLVAAGRPHDGVAVGDELQRCGALAGEAGRLTARRLADAITSGAGGNTLAVRSYATAVVADAYRRRYETAGKALTEAATDLAEADLLPLLRGIGTDAVRHADRLAALRGGVVPA